MTKPPQRIDTLIDRYLDLRDQARDLREEMREIIDEVESLLGREKRFRDRNWATRHEVDTVRVRAHDRRAVSSIRMGKVRI